MKNERDVKRKVKAALEAAGAWYTMPQTGGFGRSGIPDFLCCLNGHFIGIECKFGRNPPTALQQRELDAIQTAKGATFLVTDQDVHLLPRLLLRFTQ